MSSKVKSAKLYKEGNSYFINATYICEDSRAVREICIPKIEVPLLSPNGSLVINSVVDRDNPHVLNRFLGTYYYEGLRILNGPGGYPCVEKIIEEKAQEMTLEDIEKKLGYKIKIVSDKK